MRTLLTLLPILGLTFLAAQSSARAPERKVCATVCAEACAEVYLPLDDKARGEFLRGPIENTSIALTEVTEHVRSLPEANTRRMFERAAFVAETCPYNGSIIEVVQVLNTTFERLQRKDLVQLELTIAKHWKLLEDLEVTNKNGLDYSDATSLAKYLRTVREQVNALTTQERDAIAEAVRTVNIPTGQLWVSKLSLIRYRSQLQDAIKTDPSAGTKDLADLVSMLDELIALYC